MAACTRPYFPRRPKPLKRLQFSKVSCCLNFLQSRSPFGHGAGVAYPCEEGIFRKLGEAVMANVLNEILLFSSMAAFATGVVLAAASLLI
jgi:hypothetical protein